MKVEAGGHLRRGGGGGDTKRDGSERHERQYKNPKYEAGNTVKTGQRCRAFKGVTCLRRGAPKSDGGSIRRR